MTPRQKNTLFWLLLLGVASSSCARRYRVEGLVLDVNPEGRTMVVSHQAIPGYMGAMAMPFRVASARDLKMLEPGNQVEFQLVVKGQSSHAEKIRAERSAELARPSGDEAFLPLPSPKETLPLGSLVPDFRLVNQSDQTVRLSDFKGKVAAVNFIYTRCPLPEVCPRLSANFAHLQKRFQNRMGKDLVLLSITLDSQYDTPRVLAEYASRWGANSRGWHFLTGAPEGIERIANRFGLVFWPDEGLLTHTSQTGIISRDGCLAALIEGSSYEEQQLGDFIARQLEGVHASDRHTLDVAR
ncbi:MAG: SCO family protein [Acidobacteria bacterium]|nr:SCO family protein [Acidobacteriota bacterium]MCI0624863.1 SCO family protein [Acidobacteriota bacterium]MCI0724422.1 SCO family protein [Acidobacteriota bacterium]